MQLTTYLSVLMAARPSSLLVWGSPASAASAASGSHDLFTNSIHYQGQQDTLFGKPGQSLEIESPRGGFVLVAVAKADNVDADKPDKAMIHIEMPHPVVVHESNDNDSAFGDDGDDNDDDDGAQQGQRNLGDAEGGEHLSMDSAYAGMRRCRARLRAFAAEVARAAMAAEWGGVYFVGSLPGRPGRPRPGRAAEDMLALFVGEMARETFRLLGHASPARAERAALALPDGRDVVGPSTVLSYHKRLAGDERASSVELRVFRGNGEGLPVVMGSDGELELPRAVPAYPLAQRAESGD